MLMLHSSGQLKIKNSMVVFSVREIIEKQQ
jgi:hypothetical protein